jgi:protein involved in ribonucleotide reduction
MLVFTIIGILFSVTLLCFALVLSYMKIKVYLYNKKKNRERFIKKAEYINKIAEKEIVVVMKDYLYLDYSYFADTKFGFSKSVINMLSGIEYAIKIIRKIED